MSRDGNRALATPSPPKPRKGALVFFGPVPIVAGTDSAPVKQLPILRLALVAVSVAAMIALFLALR